MSEVRRFELAIPHAQLDDLNRRLDAARWPEKETVDDWSQGVPLAALRELVAYWRNGYDWRRCEARLNGLGSSVTRLDGLDFHYLHVRSRHEDAMPVVLTHGWPGSIVEFLDTIGPLTNPEAHGGSAADAFHVVIPSLPGYGFSGKPTATGWNIERIARAWAELMARLGYERWFAQGGDWGSIVTVALGAQAPKGLAGIHLNLPVARPTRTDFESPGRDEQRAIAASEHYKKWESGYSTLQSTRPQTIGYSLVDSPVGLAAWIYEKMWSWTDNAGRPEDALSRDTILDNIMLYWLPAAGASAARLYWESFGTIGRVGKVHVPAAVSIFPREISRAPRSWSERILKNIVSWNEAEKGGHFAAWEQPELFVRELRAAFRLMR
ncbi:MAG: epoxide hydrolase [Novosphingobium sp.]|nr:epoxide hydrolase [Novosphingobium sp.]